MSSLSIERFCFSDKHKVKRNLVLDFVLKLHINCSSFTKLKVAMNCSSFTKRKVVYQPALYFWSVEMCYLSWRCVMLCYFEDLFYFTWNLSLFRNNPVCHSMLVDLHSSACSSSWERRALTLFATISLWTPPRKYSKVCAFEAANRIASRSCECEYKLL